MTDMELHEEQYQGQLSPRLWWKIIRLGRRQWPAMAGMVLMAMVMAVVDLSFTLVTR